MGKTKINEDNTAETWVKFNFTKEELSAIAKEGNVEWETNETKLMILIKDVIRNKITNLLDELNPDEEIVEYLGILFGEADAPEGYAKGIFKPKEIRPPKEKVEKAPKVKKEKTVSKLEL